MASRASFWGEDFIMDASAEGRKTFSDWFQILLRIVMALSAVGAVVFAFLLFRSGREYAQGDAVYEKARAAVSIEAAAPENEAAVSGIAPEGTVPEIDFSALQQTSSDVVGWILSEGNAISYPVVQGDDNDYYLTHLFNGEPNKLGSVFMDYRSSGDFSDRNTVLYGHNMKDGSMFSSLIDYADQSHYDRFPEMVLYTPEGNYTIELFAGLLADGQSGLICRTFGGDEEFQDYVDSLKESSTFSCEVPVGPGDRIVTLCTCSYAYDDARYLLFGKLTPLETSSAE